MEAGWMDEWMDGWMAETKKQIDEPIEEKRREWCVKDGR
jgi:hypothetical protein